MIVNSTTYKDTPCTDSYRHYRVSQIVSDVKESLCEVAPSYNEASLRENAGIPYELPDRTTFELSYERYLIPEVGWCW